MNILSIDTSTSVATVGLYADDSIKASVLYNHNKTHSVFLMPMIDQMLDACDMQLNDIEYIAVGVGPGSFTGLRIGVVTAKTLAQTIDIPCVEVNSLQAMSYNVPYFDGIVCSMMDARRNRVFCCCYENYMPLFENDVLDINVLLEKLKAYNKKVLFVGDGAVKFKQDILDAGHDFYFAPSHLNMPKGDSVIMAAIEKIKKDETVSYNDLTPNYVLQAYAEKQKVKA